MRPASSAPAARKPTDSSNGPDGPRAPAASVASWPAVIATSASPAYLAAVETAGAMEVVVAVDVPIMHLTMVPFWN